MDSSRAGTGSLSARFAGLRSSVRGKGIYEILVSGVLNKIAQLASMLILPAILGSGIYGSYGFATSVLGLFMMFQGLGTAIATLQFCTTEHDPDARLTILRYSLKKGILFNLIVMVAMLAYGFLVTQPMQGAKQAIVMMIGLPLLVTIYETIQNYQRSIFANRHYGAINVINSVLFLVLSPLGASAFGIQGVVAGQYIAYLVSILLALRFLQKDESRRVFGSEVGGINQALKRTYWRYAWYSSWTSALSALLYQVDIFLVGLLTHSGTATGVYKFASLIPSALSFVPVTIMIWAYPYAVRLANKPRELAIFSRRIVMAMAVINLIASALVMIVAPLAIVPIFGKQYTGAIPLINILLLGYVINGTLRIPIGNLMAASGMVKENLIVSAVGGAIIIGFDLLFISMWGERGAAWASVSVFSVTSVLALSLFLGRFRKPTAPTNVEVAS
jgi:O-antigen/teichoic acid export membrane protein